MSESGEPTPALSAALREAATRYRGLVNTWGPGIDRALMILGPERHNMLGYGDVRPVVDQSAFELEGVGPGAPPSWACLAANGNPPPARSERRSRTWRPASASHFADQRAAVPPG